MGNRVPKRVVVAATCAVALAALLPAHAGGLKPNERGLAASISDNTPWNVNTEQSLRSRAHPLGVQTLAIEWHSLKAPQGQRLARVLQYDHSARRARRLIIDVDTRSLVQEIEISSVHLPLGTQEEAWVLQHLEQDARVLSSINTERAHRGQASLTSLGQLNVKATIHEPLDNTDVCHTERCALVSLFDSEQRVYVIEPVVVFASGNIQLELAQ